MQSINNFFDEMWKQLQSVFSDLAEYMVYVFDPNSGPWPKVIVGSIFFLLVMFVVTRASKAK